MGSVPTNGKEICRKEPEVLVDKLDISLHHGQFWAHKNKRDKGTLKQVQQRHTKMIKGLEHPDKERLSEFRLLSLGERKLGGGE